jgi:hypothetical protein
VPVIVCGNGFTVTTAVAVQPVLMRYVIVVVPADIPATTPVADPIVATEGVLLDHETPTVDTSDIVV